MNNQREVKYFIQPREKCWALFRFGPRGGSKFITVYKKREVAESVRDFLNGFVDEEGVRQ